MAKQFPIHAANTLPPILYKYMPWDPLRKNSLISGELWFSKPSDFNDPFEFHCKIPWPDSPTEQQEILALACDIAEPDAPQHIRESKIRDFQKEVSQYRGQVPIAKENLWNNISICCMSKLPNNMLMWSHYAEGHRGICIGISTESLKSVCSIAEVEYADEVISVPWMEAFGVTATNHLLRVARTKGLSWSYEEEWRLVRVQKPHGLVKLPKGAIVSLIVGCKASASTCLEILDSALQTNPDIELFAAVDSRDHYRLELVPRFREGRFVS